MRVLVLWADGRSANLGVRVLAEGAEVLARGAFGPKTEVVFQDLGPNAEGFRVSTDLIKADLGRRRGPIKQWLRQFDAVLDTGAGDSFTDIYGRNRLARITYTQLTARALDLPLVMLPQTVGPFTGLGHRVLARRVLKRASVVMTRDRASTAHASELGRADAVEGTDLVFSLPTVVADKTRDVVLNVSGLLWRENRHVDSRRYRESVVRLIEGLLAADRSVALLPHVLENATQDNDMIPLAELARRYPDLEIIDPWTLADARTAVASANWVIGARMHACLNALSVGTPAIPWAYSRKFQPLLEGLNWSETIDLRVAEGPASATVARITSAESPVDQLKESLRIAGRKSLLAMEACREIAGRGGEAE
ncbi:polysaccharide pyruvyl transferase family protein [Microbacterium sp. CCNWLW134]|uniref:polysaccharide pyruvyl transferase family protein n=1 Tax=Microbacterium sp. CCNWLW134 TaxID=3122064 RepID=UPI00301021C2